MVNSGEIMEEYVSKGGSVRNDKHQLFDRLHKVLLADPRSVKQITKEIGLAPNTVHRLMDGDDNLHARSYYILAAWLKQEEERLGIQ